MTAILGTDIESDVRLILADASGASWTQAQIVVAVNSGIRSVIRERPSAAYTTLVDFDTDIELTMTGTGGTTIGSTDSIAIDSQYRDYIANYAAYLLLLQDSRNTVNLELADVCLKRCKDML